MEGGGRRPPTGGTRAENIAAGNATAEGAFTQWRNSAGHNTNMLNGDYRVIGIGRGYDAASTYGWYWTTTFGGQVDAVFEQ
ncbi:MAG: CAP domain-containing protein [Myxococcota bacterium]|nr:CAP domain-containing protein [Myxococcota bacterium]